MSVCRSHCGVLCNVDQSPQCPSRRCPGLAAMRLRCLNMGRFPDAVHVLTVQSTQLQGMQGFCSRKHNYVLGTYVTLFAWTLRYITQRLHVALWYRHKPKVSDMAMYLPG